MSGGSMNYLYCAELDDLFHRIEDLEDAEKMLIDNGYKDVGKDVRRLIEYINSAEVRIGVLFENLNNVLWALEWWRSADIGEDRVKEEIEKYRRGK